MHARLLVQGIDMLSRTASQRCIRSLDNLSHLPLRQRPTWRVQQLQRCGALPSGTPPLSPWSPIADVRMAPCRAASSDTTPEGLKQQPQRFERLRVKGDGACMFRSVVQGDALLSTGSLLSQEREWEAAQKLRQDVVEQLRSSREDIEPFIPGIVEGVETFDSYLARMSRPGTWGGEPELAMAVKVLQRPIAVYQPTFAGPQHIITYGEEYDQPPMHVLWSGAHYDLMVPAGIRSKL